jgi:excisionase family DNA binding protein
MMMDEEYFKKYRHSTTEFLPNQRRTKGVTAHNEVKLVNVDELAGILNIPKTWIYERTRQGQDAIPHVRLGSYVRFDVEEVLDFFRTKGPMHR